MAHLKPPQPGSGLVAVLLITRSRPGPRLVFHYPEHPYLPPVRRRRDDPDSDDSSDSETDEEDAKTANGDGAKAEPEVNLVTQPMKGNRYIIPDKANPDLKVGAESKPGRKVLGHSVESLEKVLSPGRWCDGKKFEISLNGLTFLGHPIYAPIDGEWGPKQPDVRTPQKSNSKDAKDTTDLDIDNLNVTSPEPPTRTSLDFAHVTDSLDSQTNAVLGTSVDTSSSANSGTPTEPISMFQVVLVLRGSGIGAQKNVKAVYIDIAEKLSRALEYCQKQADYVARESRKILALRAKAKPGMLLEGKTLWEKMLETSELTWALKEVYEKISKTEVAGIRLNGMEMSLYLSHASTQRQQQPSESKPEPGPLSALLLLEPKETLLRELSHPDASPLAIFVRECTPTKNLSKKAAHLGMSLEDVLYLSFHLTKWRKACILSQPLHARNTYVVAPSAPIDDLHQHIEAYHRLFPTLPTLPNMLKVLSGRPIRFGVLIPSRDHRSAYMEILSYLVRHGFVVQLRSYGYLKISKSFARAAADVGKGKRPVTARSLLLSPRLRAVDDDEGSVYSDRTAVANHGPATPTISTRTSKRLSNETQSTTEEYPSSKDEGEQFAIIASPTYPTDQEAELIAALKMSFRDIEMRDHFDRLLAHLDGEHAFEEVAAKEGLKRARVEEWLSELDDMGSLLMWRHI